MTSSTTKDGHRADLSGRGCLIYRGLTAGMKARKGAFTLIELLVVIAIIAILAAIMLPVLSAAQKKAQGIQCMNNVRQILIGWKEYSTENTGYFPINPTTTSQALIDNLDWVCNDDDAYTGTDTDDTNAALLVDSKHSQLAVYVTNPKVYRCPADPSMTKGLSGVPRVLTYDMSQTVGAGSDFSRNGPPNPGGGGSPQGQWAIVVGCQSPLGGGLEIYRNYIKDGDLIAPGPSDLFVFTEEDPDSKNNPDFAFHMPKNPAGGEFYWVDYPAKFHDLGCSFGFADGHCEIHRWRDPGQLPGFTGVHVNEGLYPGSKDDCGWLAKHVTAPTSGNKWPF
ncbi:MAG TPA: prepilin-type N-terminal cleavage/methylation domain-containing protein [Verrucomicrobiae bacterium]|nr:prepilin-type N-terminal cleavage/methylation domain-containing protein [Verrucomicrobiae bacterium]